MQERKIRVAITHGDTNSTGYELLFKAFDEPTMFDLCTPIIYGSPKVAAYHRKALGTETNFSIISKAEEAHEDKLNLLTTFDDEIKVDLGQPTPESGLAGLKALDRAMTDFRQGDYDVLVTLPLNGADLTTADFKFPGQTRYIEASLDEEGQSMQILTNEYLRLALATTRIPLKEVASTISKELIVETVTTLQKSLRRDFRISNPRIAILALNPRNGDGSFGKEEDDIIAPAIGELASADINAFGPYAAEEFFGNGLFEHFDAVMAMYDDQGLAPFATLTTDCSTLFTSGLSIVRTAPTGEADFENAGKGVADPLALRHAIYLAVDIYRHRMEYDEPLANPLKKLYKEKRDEGDRPRFAAPKKIDSNS